jgi:hypothetical protein
LAATFGLAVACEQRESRTERVDDPYDGSSPYPNLRGKVSFPANDFAIIPNSTTDTLTLIDLALGAPITTAPVGRNPVVFDGPHQIVASFAARRGYVMHTYPAAFEDAGVHTHGSSTRAGWIQVVNLDDFSVVGEVGLDPNPGNMELSEDGRRLVVTHYDLTIANRNAPTIDGRRATIAYVDPAAILPFGTSAPEKVLVCVAPHGLALSHPDAKTAFVTCYGEDAVAIVNLEDPNAPVERVPLGPDAHRSGTPSYGPYGTALSPDGARLAIGSRYSRDVRFLDVTTRTMTPLVVPLLGEVYSPSWSSDGKRLYAPTRSLDAIVALDTTTGDVVAQRLFNPETCVAPLEVEVAPSGKVLVTCEGTAQAPGSLVTLDPADLIVEGRIELGTFPGRPFIGRGP